jgi:hypothetical protein
MYLIAILLFLLIGFNKWDLQNEGKFWGYMIFYHIALAVGYIFAMKLKSKNDANLSNNESMQFNLNIVMWAVLVLCVFYFFTMFSNATGQHLSYIKHFFKDTIAALKNPGRRYYNYYMNKVYEGNKYLSLLAGIFSIFTYLSIPLYIWFWDTAKLLQRICFIAVTLLNLSLYVNSGQNANNFIVSFFFCASFILCWFFSHNRKDYIKKRITVILFMMFLLLFSVFFFTKSMTTRTGSVTDMYVALNDTALQENTSSGVSKAENSKTGSDAAEDSAETSKDEDEVEEEAILIAPVPRYNTKSWNRSLSNLIYGAENYLTNGYFMFSLGLGEQSEYLLGLGGNSFVRNNLAQLFHIDVSDKLIESKLNNKYNGLQYFSSIYLAVANDFGFVGVAVFLAVLSIFTAFLWYDALIKKNFIAIAILPLMIVEFLFFPVTNIIGDKLVLMFPFAFLTFIYLASKIYRKVRGSKVEII